MILVYDYKAKGSSKVVYIFNMVIISYTLRVYEVQRKSVHFDFERNPPLIVEPNQGSFRIHQ